MPASKRDRKAAAERRAQQRVDAARTAANKEKVLAEYRELGNVSYAAKAAEISRRIHAEWLQDDAEYPAAFDAAAEQAADVLEAEARRRAVTGVEEPVFGSLGAGCGSGVVGHVQKYSDVLLIFLLKGARPEKFAQRHVLGGKGKRGAILLEEIVAGNADAEE